MNIIPPALYTCIMLTTEWKPCCGADQQLAAFNKVRLMLQGGTCTLLCPSPSTLLSTFELKKVEWPASRSSSSFASRMTLNSASACCLYTSHSTLLSGSMPRADT